MTHAHRRSADPHTTNLYRRVRAAAPRLRGLSGEFLSATRLKRLAISGQSFSQRHRRAPSKYPADSNRLADSRREYDRA